MSQKEDVATNNEEAKVRCIHWAKNLRRTLHADLYEKLFADIPNTRFHDSGLRARGRAGAPASAS